MNTLFFKNTLYRIKKEYPNHLLCQIIDLEGEDIGSDGTPIKNILRSQRWKNAGLLGGDVDTVISFINKFLAFYFQAVSDSHFNPNRPDCGVFDMGLFNYIARTHFADRLVHGTQVNTVFKAEKANNVSWFKHK